MRRIRLSKVVVNMGVGESGKRLANAEAIVKTLTGQSPVRTIARKSVFKARRGEPIGVVVTLRKKRAREFLERALDVVEKRLPERVFDAGGNFSFGIEDHTDFGLRYDPDVGIFGLDVAVALERPGYRVARRRIRPRPVPKAHRVTREEAVEFVRQNFGVEVE
ncbi:MAG: 50S ribosomal protein L5 [Halobacteria archaeon]